MKPESAAALPDPVEVHDKLWKVKLSQPKGFFKVGLGKKHAQANALYLEINGSRKFEIGNDCDTCHFWFKCVQEPRVFTQKKVVNLPKAVSIPRPVDAALIRELSPMLDLMDKGEHYVFNTNIHLAGPYRFDDEASYFFNGEFQEIWDIEDPAAEGLLSGWEHYEGRNPRVFRSGGILEKQFDFVIPLVPTAKLKAEYIQVYRQMIANGDRPRVLLLGMIQRPVPESVSTGAQRNMHSFFAGFVLDGHHKLAAYHRAGVPANCLVVVPQKASKYFLLKDEGDNPRVKMEERLATLAV